MVVTMSTARTLDREYDVCLSFAGEQRSYVEEVADRLREMRVRVFYDDYERVSLWGKNLYDHLDYIYSRSARYCVIFVSEAYERKVWTSHERRSAQERALKENDEYILPVIFDETRLPGLPSTMGYFDARETDTDDLAVLIRQKLGVITRWRYIPKDPTRLFEALKLSDADEKRACVAVANDFVNCMARADEDERRLVVTAFTNKCPHDAMADPHTILDYLRRVLRKPAAEIVASAKAMSALGFMSRVEGHGDSEDVLHLCWVSRSTYVNEYLQDFAQRMSTQVSLKMIDACLPHLCEDCIERLALDLDFSALDDNCGDSF
jgi:TIR domain